MYRVAGNDVLSPSYKITTYVPPTVQDFNIQLSYPVYNETAAGNAKITGHHRIACHHRPDPNLTFRRAKTSWFSEPAWNWHWQQPDGTEWQCHDWPKILIIGLSWRITRDIPA